MGVSHSPPPSWAINRDAEPEMESSEPELLPTWDASTAGKNIACCATLYQLQEKTMPLFLILF